MNANLRTTMKKIIHRAGLEQWPRLFHNLRSSRETELLKGNPIHVVAAWMGHDAKVCLKHYAQVTDEHFQAATSAASCLPIPARNDAGNPTFPSGKATIPGAAKSAALTPENALQNATQQESVSIGKIQQESPQMQQGSAFTADPCESLPKFAHGNSGAGGI
ncbi:MAG: hypothetical protein LC104_00475 [Bacteroidales bacterium]|nr:hypothetical protein [Bacteroidales bacterium]